ncbi:uncharacterized protein LOC120661891 isoform X2 [Panicum virgatum]|uniref:uncharacterized protein LOC120661891 isoform X2 n=1 Tax=Panicum virgatum TaxID=38727 RepID=UPI0019D529FE|nr:uncharacterized protein LOC120661891 isoform X2 [Panicum virgatum]
MASPRTTMSRRARTWPLFASSARTSTESTRPRRPPRCRRATPRGAATPPRHARSARGRRLTRKRMRTISRRSSPSSAASRTTTPVIVYVRPCTKEDAHHLFVEMLKLWTCCSITSSWHTPRCHRKHMERAQGRLKNRCMPDGSTLVPFVSMGICAFREPSSSCGWTLRDCQCGACRFSGTTRGSNLQAIRMNSC